MKKEYKTKMNKKDHYLKIYYYKFNLYFMIQQTIIYICSYIIINIIFIIIL